MTTVDVIYQYSAVPSEAAVMGITRLREVYGVRRVELREREKSIRVEYDSTRLSEATIHQMLRRGGLDVTERVTLASTPAPAPVPAS